MSKSRPAPQLLCMGTNAASTTQTYMMPLRTATLVPSLQQLSAATAMGKAKIIHMPPTTVLDVQDSTSTLISARQLCCAAMLANHQLQPCTAAAVHIETPSEDSSFKAGLCATSETVAVRRM